MGSPRIDRLDKNYLINGNMEIWQRVVGNLTTINNTNQSPFRTADRMETQSSGPSTKNYSIGRSTDVPNSTYKYPFSHQFNCLTALTSPASLDFMGHLVQRIEGNFFRDIHQRMVTLGFWIKITSPSSTFPVQYPVCLRNNADNRSMLTSFQINANDTWQFVQKSIQLDLAGSWNLDHTTGLAIFFGAATGSFYHTANQNVWQTGPSYTGAGMFNTMGFNTNVVRVTGLQLVLGERTLDSNEFIRAGRDYKEELQLCQRYYEKSYDLNVVPGTISTNGAKSCDVSGVAVISGSFEVRKRVTPTVVIYNPDTGNINETRYRNTIVAGASGATNGNNAGLLTGETSYLADGSNADQFVAMWHYTADAEI